MSKTDVERFISDLKGDAALLGEMQEISAGIASIVQFAKDKGYDVSVDEAKSYISEKANQDLSDEQLDAIAGGKGHHHSSSGSSASTQVQVEVQAVEVLQVAEVAQIAEAAEVGVVAVAVVVLT